MKNRCEGCGAKVQFTDPTQKGFIRNDVYLKNPDRFYCERCFNLLHYHKNTEITYNEKDFLLNNLITDTPPDTSWENRLYSTYFSEKYVFDNIIKGYYGIQEAVDNLVAFAKDKSNDTKRNEGVPRAFAIWNLADGGYYQNFENRAELYRSNEGRRFPLNNYMMKILIRYG